MQSTTSSSLGLNVGPSGRAIAQPMDVDLLEALYQHTSLERVSSAQYLAMSLWFLERELRGFASFFKRESLCEQEHGFNFAKYMIARGQTVELEEVTKPIQVWNTVKELVTNNVPFDRLIMGIERGPRYLINDMDPNKPGKRAIAINLNRDQGIL